MNPYLSQLLDYPFDRLRELKRNISPNSNLSQISLALGEPRHKPPSFILEAVASNLNCSNQYPPILGTPELRSAIANWLERRYSLSPLQIDRDRQVIVACGTREALFCIVQALVDTRNGSAAVAMPNPFYAIYEGAAILAGATPLYLPCTRDTNYLPDFEAISPKEWNQCKLLFLCSPNNPTGAVLPRSHFMRALELADRFGFIIASDECYSEIYFNESTPPPGLLEVCKEQGRSDFKNCLVLNSLSKRSSIPGLRSGFIAGDEVIISRLSKYRSYHGCAISYPIQAASALAWQDETHVVENRNYYKEKLQAVHAVLQSEHKDKDYGTQLHYTLPEASFFIWAETTDNDRVFTRELYRTKNVTVLPGSFLARDGQNASQTSSTNGCPNPGSNRIRIALVAELDECVDAARRIASFLGKPS